MQNVNNWILGAFAALLAVGALYVTARAGHGVGYYGGLAMFVFCVLFILYLMKTTFDHQERAKH
ncbi:MAG: hypothetical protein FJX67_17845 [Alphaproteobacteria bacterium]|nr:hypothetical protein [Alphaproteobacteria bacterium]